MKSRRAVHTPEGRVGESHHVEDEAEDVDADETTSGLNL